MNTTRIIRDRKVKTLQMMGAPRCESVEGKTKLVYARRKGMAVIKDLYKDVYGIVNYKNQLICDKYDFCCYPKLGIAFVMKKDKWGFVNTEGKLICKCEYDHIYSFKDKFAITRKGNSYGLVNINGEVILKCVWTREKVLYTRRRIRNRF